MSTESTIPDSGRVPKPRVRNLSAIQHPQQQGGRKCARCSAAFGRFYNTGAVCPRCRNRVCRQCRELRTPDADDWLCSLCSHLCKIQDLRSVSAEWRRSTTGRDNYLSALDILKYSIRRAWTINGPPARWSASRKSAEFRLYRSLPNRRRDYLDDKNLKNAKKPPESLIKQPKIQAKLGKPGDPKKSSIPVFRNRSSKEFEDIRSPHESPKRSLIPQRYRGSTDDLRRSREDISAPSLIPKLLSPRNKEDKLKRQEDSRPPTIKPVPALRRDIREETSLEATSPIQECSSTGQNETGPAEEEPPKMVNESSPRIIEENPTQVAEEIPHIFDESSSISNELKTRDETDDASQDSSKEFDKQKLSETIGRKIDEPVVIRRGSLSKEELSNEDTDDAHNRRSSSHLSPEASPLSTRSSRYSPRESESEPTPALPRKIGSGESSSSSQRIRDAITRTRRESNSSAKYESSGSEGVRLSESGISSYVDIARRVKLFGSGTSTGTCDEILQRDSATSAGEDEHDEHSRDPSRMGSFTQNRVMLRRRRQFDTQGPRRRGRSHARAASYEEHPGVLLGRSEEEVGPHLDYRRLVFISSDSSSGREEDDADSSCSGSSYLTGQPQPGGHRTSGGCGLEDCDWDYFESNSLKLPPITPVTGHTINVSHNSDWSCCPARPLAANVSTNASCQTCGGSRNAKVLPVPVPIPVPVPYPVPIPASLWTGEFPAGSMISRDAARLEQSLPLSLRGCDPSAAAGSWFSWNPRFDPSTFLQFSQGHVFQQRELSTTNDAYRHLQPEKSEEKSKPEAEPTETVAEAGKEEPEPVHPEPRMFRHSQEQDSSGRSSADSSELEESHRFSRVLVVNDDSLTSDIEDSDESHPKSGHQEPVVLRRIRVLEEDAELEVPRSPEDPSEDEPEEPEEPDPEGRDVEDPVLLKSVRSIDPDGSWDSAVMPEPDSLEVSAHDSSVAGGDTEPEPEPEPEPELAPPSPPRPRVSRAEEELSAALMAKSRKKWQIPASFDIKGIPSTHFMPPERRKEAGPNPLFTAAQEVAVDDVLHSGVEPEESEEDREEEREEEPEGRRDWQASNKYRSLVMITQAAYHPVNVVASDTTTVVQPRNNNQQHLQDSFADAARRNQNLPKKPVPCKRINPEAEVDSGLSVGSASESDDVQNSTKQPPVEIPPEIYEPPTKKGPVILEEGLADDDSWVEEISHDEDEQSVTTATEESSEDEAANDREEELRGYHRQAIDFTLHTIVEESCEESESEHANASWRRRLASAPDLDKYYFFGLGADATNGSREVDSLSESSSVFSEGLDSLAREEEKNPSQEKTEYGRVEKYFLAEFLGLEQDRRDSDGSVGSDSEGRPSPEAQRRKRLVRARGTGRSHSSSLDNLLALSNSLQEGSPGTDGQESQSEGSSTETDGAEENPAAFGTDGQFDTVKRKKKKLRNPGAQSPRVTEDRNKTPEPTEELDPDIAGNSEEDGAKTPQPEMEPNPQEERAKQQSRDSGFVGSCDDLLQTPRSQVERPATPPEEPKERPPSNIHERILETQRLRDRLTGSGSLSRKDSFNNWSSDEETNLMMSKMRQFFKTMVATQGTASPVPSPRVSRARNFAQRTKPPQLVYFENELTRLMKTVPGIRDEQVREIVEYLSSEDTWSDSYDSSDYTSSDLEGPNAGGRRSALQEQISQSCQQIISKFDAKEEHPEPQQPCLGRDTAFVYQKLVQSFTKMAGNDNVASDASSTPHSSPPLIAKVMHHIGSRLVALMHEVSESNSTGGHSHASQGWRRYPHHRTPSSASTTEDDESTSDSASAPTHLPRSKSHDPLLLINGHAGAASMPPEAEEREASDYERFSWRGSFESALMAADSRTKLSLLACSGDVSATAMAAKRRSAGDLLFNPKSFSREQLDRVRSCGSIGGTVGAGPAAAGSIEEKIWSNRRRSSVPDANTRGESGASAGDEDTEDEENEELEYPGDPRATTLPRGQAITCGATSASNSLPRQSGSSGSMHKAHSVYHFLPQHSAVKSARYRPPGFTRTGPTGLQPTGPKRAFSAPGLQIQSRTRRQQSINQANLSTSASGSADEASSLSEACSTPIIGASSRTSSSHASMDLDDIDRSLHAAHLATRASLSSLGARSDSMASVYSGAGEGRWCGSVAVRGEVEFSLQYDYKQLTFEVHVTQCRDLAPVDVKRNRSDPYVKVYLLPDKSKSGKRKTKVKKHTLNPVFDETLKFHTSLNSLESRTLWLTVWHSDMFGRNDFLGEVRMPLENKIFDDPRPQWYPLQERTEPFDDPVAYKGEVIVGLKFVPPDPSRQDRDRESSLQRANKCKKNWSRGALHVLVKEARNLQTRAKNSGTCDPFCKSYLLPDKGRSGKQKTGVVRRSTGSPVWNHTFVYKDVSLQELADRGLELTVWDHDRIASNEFLGGVRFNLGTGKHYGKAVDWMDATGREMSLWQSMLERPNFWVEGAVTLRPNLHNHGKTGTS